ncbi:helix-turn-helix domain-containing protein [Burkholderia vietnamiensis]|uniref:helix-turn-helix domain-containing protein n=1 Tax=Burkholderia vietnamiensis TaxID=60552 RepID=UPI001CF43B41|nr:helix-turn-helix transcriptional regulator [Burkholderia vietnamiensis]MCA8287615.1 helix-turn-helix domain-containing protein [Burkholderia vietnamiensis]
MTIDDQNITTYHAVCAVVLRELRVQRRMHPAQFADFLAKLPSAWQNIESGKARLDFDTLLRVGRGLSVPPSAILQVVDGYEFFLRSFQWSIVVNDLEGKDGLIKLANDYWKSPGCRSDEAQTYGTPILNVPHQNNGWQNVRNVFGYAVDPQFRAQQHDEERFKPLPSALDLAMQNGANGGNGLNGVNGDPEGI